MIQQLINFLNMLQGPNWTDGVYHTVSDDEWSLLIAEDEDYCSSGYGVGSVTVRYPFWLVLYTKPFVTTRGFSVELLFALRSLH